jgi:uncharacterized protein YsxB (DUF464 family)
MIKAQFFKTSGDLKGFKVNGHSGYAQSGRDIACAGVTSAVMMAANTITEIIGANANVKISEAEVSLLLTGASPKDAEYAAKAVLKGLEMHLKILSEEFQGFISVYDLEV